MKVMLVFEDWKHTATNKSVYGTEKGVELSMGNLHSGTMFKADIDFSVADEIDIREAAKDGIDPVFYVVERKKK